MKLHEEFELYINKYNDLREKIRPMVNIILICKVNRARLIHKHIIMITLGEFETDYLTMKT